MAYQPFNEDESESFQDIMLAAKDCPGAAAFRIKENFEVHVRSDDRSTDFPEPVQSWLAEHGFTRAFDTQRGPFYYR